MAMLCGRFLTVLCLAGLAVGHSLPQNVPTFAPVYNATGVLSLPYAEIEEPFKVYYDSVRGRSRIDYYDFVQTIQRADINTSYKVAPMTTYSVQNELTCFQVNGTIDIQSIFPDLTNFTKVGSGFIDSTPVDIWEYVEMVGTKKNTYTMWIKQDGTPVQYQMMGFDSLLSSHYDKYVVKYNSYKVYDPSVGIPEDIFTPKKTKEPCGGFPGPGAEHMITMNPMQEFIHKDDHHIQKQFQVFKQTHKKNYPSNEEHSSRLHAFRQNLRYINSKNRAGLSYKLAVNHLADMSDTEMKMMRGYRFSKGPHGGLAFDKTKYAGRDIPDQIDWRLYGAVTPVKDQGVCGSCWSFGTTGTLEGALFLKTGNLIRLSQQQLIDCSWAEGNNACDGGEDFRSYNYIMHVGGLLSEEQYGPYLAQDGKCKAFNNITNPALKISGYVNITSGDLDGLRVAVAVKGPISVAIDASHRSLSFYSNGVYYEPQCGNTPDDLDHAVLAVGYGMMNNEPYWLVKNSWSTYWGNDGYVLMSQRDNNCGVATAATFVEV